MKVNEEGWQGRAGGKGQRCSWVMSLPVGPQWNWLPIAPPCESIFHRFNRLRSPDPVMRSFSGEPRPPRCSSESRTAYLWTPGETDRQTERETDGVRHTR
ncbi:unnamed protein product [Arctogadus glacialis]